MFSYPDSTTGFIQTHFYWPCQFHWYNKLSENIIQNLPPKWIIGSLEVYKELMHCFIVFPWSSKYFTSEEYMIST